MARSFKTKDTRRIIKTHTKISSQLNYVINLSENYKNAIKDNVNNYISNKINETLSSIPVDELNRNKQGIRVKSLHDSGYNNISHIAYKTVLELKEINGISLESAYAIRETVDKMVNQVVDVTKLALSVDNKTPETTAIVRCVDIYRKIFPCANRCTQLLNTYSEKVNTEIENVATAKNGVKWLFSSKENKDKAETAYEFLTYLAKSEYGTFADESSKSAIDVEKITDEECWSDFEKYSIQFYNILEEIVPNALGNNNALGLPDELAKQVESQELDLTGLSCELRKYQLTGVKYAFLQQRVLLGDEMGLGKTIQAIALMVALRNIGATHFMVICPASVIANWCREITEKSDLIVVKIHGQDKSVALENWVQNGGVAVTTYETTSYIDLDDSFRFENLIVDEAHYIKNPEARRSRNVRNIADYAKRVLFMTGTALENRVNEMIELISILQPQIANEFDGMEYLSSAPEFREKVAPVYYRRKREEVLTELPQLIENKEWLDMNAVEKEAYYNAVMSDNMQAPRRVSWNVANIADSSKAKRLKEIVDEATDDGRKVIVFSYFLDTIKKVKLVLGDKCVDHINGAVSPQRRQEIIDEFNNAKAGAVLPAQIQAGGTGLNIQSASVVIICEPQFKPSIENQAISRAYRMGQTRNVLVYRLLCEDSIDEQMMKMLNKKQNIFNEFADKSSAKDTIEINEETFNNMMKAEYERVKNLVNNSNTEK